MRNTELAILEDNTDFIDSELDSLEQSLEAELSMQMKDIENLKEDFKKIGNAEALGDTIMNVVWEQFMNQVAVYAGEDFIKENGGKTLDLRDGAHIQTTQNFEKGTIATHNTSIDYQKRYEDYHARLEHNEDGSLKMHSTRYGTQEANLAQGARNSFDEGRPSGSVERHTDMDHTVPAGEIIRSSRANAHLSQQEQVDFANGSVNLKEMNSSHNRSKGDTPTREWVKNKNSKGLTPQEQFSDPLSPDYLSDELVQEYLKNDKKARKEFNKVLEEGEKKSVETGKESQKNEFFKIGGKALRSVIMSLLADLLKTIFKKFIAWLRSTERTVKALIAMIKEAVHDFVTNLKTYLTAAESMATTILSAIFGPIVALVKKIWTLLKQGWKSLKEAWQYLTNPANHKKSFSIRIMEVGKIIVAGLTAGGAIILGEVIEKSLMTIPFFAIEIPLIGSLANILGIFLGAIIAGIAGALAIRLLDSLIANRQKVENLKLQIDKQNDIIATESKLIAVAEKRVEYTKGKVADSISKRHSDAAEELKDIHDDMKSSIESIEELKSNSDNKLDNLFGSLATL